jgi:hypothetical protein
MIVAADRSAIVAHAGAWERDVASGRTPGELSVRVTGAFPQPH